MIVIMIGIRSPTLGGRVYLGETGGSEHELFLALDAWKVRWEWLVLRAACCWLGFVLCWGQIEGNLFCVAYERFGLRRTCWVAYRCGGWGERCAALML